MSLLILIYAVEWSGFFNYSCFTHLLICGWEWSILDRSIVLVCNRLFERFCVCVYVHIGRNKITYKVFYLSLQGRTPVPVSYNVPYTHVVSTNTQLSLSVSIDGAVYTLVGSFPGSTCRFEVTFTYGSSSSQFELRTSKDYQGSLLVGMCGNCDGDRENDFLDAHGSQQADTDAGRRAIANSFIDGEHQWL